MESVRPARAEDLGRCTDLLASALSGLRSMRGGAQLLEAADTGALAPAAADAASLVDGWARPSPDRALLAGIFEGAVVGVAAGHLAGPAGPLRGTATRLGRVDCCYVEPGARQVGVGTALASALLSWFDRRGCTDVDVLALPGDRATKQLFEAAGFSARLLVLRRRLR